MFAYVLLCLTSFNALHRVLMCCGAMWFSVFLHGVFRRIVENAEIHGGGFLDFLAKYKNRGGEVFRLFANV